MALKLESSAYTSGGMIPEKYTCDGENISPPLEWSNVPGGTGSFAIIFDDPDAPAKTWVHWVIYNIPAGQRKLEENIRVEKKTVDRTVHGINDFKKYDYGGPCPPEGTHRYFMKLYALDSNLNLARGLPNKNYLKQWKVISLIKRN